MNTDRDCVWLCLLGVKTDTVDSFLLLVCLFTCWLPVRMLSKRPTCFFFSVVCLQSYAAEDRLGEQPEMG